MTESATISDANRIKDIPEMLISNGIPVLSTDMVRRLKRDILREYRCGIWKFLFPIPTLWMNILMYGGFGTGVLLSVCIFFGVFYGVYQSFDWGIWSEPTALMIATLAYVIWWLPFFLFVYRRWHGWSWVENMFKACGWRKSRYIPSSDDLPNVLVGRMRARADKAGHIPDVRVYVERIGQDALLRISDGWWPSQEDYYIGFWNTDNPSSVIL